MKSFMLMVLCCSLLYTGLQAQDPHFSQYFTSPMTINPALTARSVSDWRAGINTRSQWWGDAVKPYYTMTASLEKRVSLAEDDHHYFGFGGMVVSDQSNGGLLKNNYFSFTTAYHLALDPAGRHTLGAGLTGTYANRVLDPGKFLFQSQFGSMGFQRDLPANDPVNIQKNHYFDMSAGLYYTYNGDGYGLSAGGALFHAAKPTEGVYYSSEYNIPRKVSLQAGGWISVGARDEIHLSSITELQGGYAIYTLGGVYKIGMDDGVLHSVNLGLWNRFNDAVYPYIGIEANRWMAGVSYDYVLSKVANYQSVQSMEFSFVWQFGKRRTTGGTPTGVLIY